MAISIDWPTGVITVPKADTTLVDIGPPEIRSLDVDQFRKDLNALQASEVGIVWETTHVHNPPLTVGGITLGRTMEIINGYTVTFENGSYAVNVGGVNNNISDVLNLNNVQTRSANSAGLQIVAVGSGLDAGQDAKLTAINNELINIEGTNDHSHMMRGIMAMVAGVLSGAEAGKSGTAVIKNMANSKTRLTITFDAHGNRTSVTYDDLT